MFGLMTTRFLVFNTGLIWSSIAVSASQMLFRRPDPLTTATTERGSDGSATGTGSAGRPCERSSAVDAVKAAVVQKKLRREILWSCVFTG